MGSIGGVEIMPEVTPRLGLSLPLGNENVSREVLNEAFRRIDSDVALQSEVDNLQEQIDNIQVPDASLTTKGIVRLSNTTNGTSQVLAATEKAVNDARVLASSDATTKANTAETNAKNYTDAKTWQKHRLTTDGGKALTLAAGTDLNTVLTNGQYVGNSLVNAPNGTNYFYVEVIAFPNSDNYIMQRATLLNGGNTNPTFYMRIRETGNWGAWQELFQLSVDMKSKIAGAINGKGGSANSSMTSDQLAQAALALTFRSATLNDGYNVTVSSSTQPQTYTKTVFTVPANSVRCYLFGTGGSFFSENTSQRIEQWVDFVDSAGVVASGPYHQFLGAADPGETFGNVRFDKSTNQITWTQNGTARTAAIPSNFNVNSAYTIRLRMFYPQNAGGSGVASTIRVQNYELAYM